MVKDNTSPPRPISLGRLGDEIEDYWTPKNYDGGSGDTLTLRRALENSRNLATVRLLDGGIEPKPEASLNRLCDQRMRAILSVRAGRPAGAADRSRSVLCRNRE
jgi:hypothetical protein